MNAEWAKTLGEFDARRNARKEKEEKEREEEKARVERQKIKYAEREKVAEQRQKYKTTVSKLLEEEGVECVRDSKLLSLSDQLLERIFTFLSALDLVALSGLHLFMITAQRPLNQQAQAEGCGFCQAKIRFGGSL